ncbi:LOW QUALITY PROTEIN: hypothetical protein V1477_017806 [Vespula maculifrons]|uniref:Uncharacterized protein n=1 Tax=Vespula maculifrons TaxID=7453 RepID=A0ABD2B0J4_VESMC
MGGVGATSPFLRPRAECSRRKNFNKKILFPLFPLNRYNSAPIGQTSTEKYVRVGRNEPFPMTPARLLSRKIFFPLFLLNRNNSAPIGQIWTKKICGCSARRAPSNEPGRVDLGAIKSEQKIKNFFFPLFPLNRHNSVLIGQIWTEKIWARRTRRAPSNESSCVDLCAIGSEQKIVKEKFFFPLISLNRYNSAPIGHILTKKNMGVARRALSNEPGPAALVKTVITRVLLIATQKIWAGGTRRALSNDPGVVALGSIGSEKKIVRKRIFFSFVHFKPLLLDSYWSYLDEENMGRRTRRALSNDSGLIALGARVSEKKLTQRALSNEPDQVPLGARVSEKKIVRKKFFSPLFPLNLYKSAPIGHIWTKNIQACRTRRAPFQCLRSGCSRARRTLSNDPGPVALGARDLEKKILKENFFLL